MDIQARFGSVTSRRFSVKEKDFISSYPQSAVRILCSKRDSSSGGGESPENGESKGDKLSTDWDNAWKVFKKQGKKKKKPFFKQFSPNKYVTWNPRQTNYPLSEEVDPIKRTERSNLRLWTSPEFTLGGAIVIVTFLLVYTISALGPVK